MAGAADGDVLGDAVRDAGTVAGATGGGGFVGVVRAGAPPDVTTAGGGAESAVAVGGAVFAAGAGVSAAGRTSSATAGAGANPLSVGCASGICGRTGATMAAGGTNEPACAGPGGDFEGNDVGFEGGGAAAVRVGSTGGIDGARGRFDGTGGGSGKSSSTSSASAGTGGLRLRPVPVFGGSAFGFDGDDEIGGGGVAATVGGGGVAATAGLADAAAGAAALAVGVFGAFDTFGATAAGGGVGAGASFFGAADPLGATAGGAGVGAVLEGAAPSVFFVKGDGKVDGDGNAPFAPPSAAGNVEVFPLPPSALGSGSADNGSPPDGSPGEIEGWLVRGGVEGAPPGRSPEGGVPSPLAGLSFPSDFAVMKTRSKPVDPSHHRPGRRAQGRCRTATSADGPMILEPRAVACQLPRKKEEALRRIARTEEIRPHRKG